MDYVNAVIEDKAAFERALDTPRTVFVVFGSPGCQACEDALPRFVRQSEPYLPHIKVLILDCTVTPQHPAVTRVPMLLIYRNGALLETLAGLGEHSTMEALNKYA